MLKYKYYPPYLILLSIAAPQCLISQLRQARERLAKQDARARTRSSSSAFACECAEQLTESRKLCTAAWRCRGYRGIPPVLLFFCRRFLFQIKRKCRNAGSIKYSIVARREGRAQILQFHIVTIPRQRVVEVADPYKLPTELPIAMLRRGYWKLDYKNWLSRLLLCCYGSSDRHP